MRIFALFLLLPLPLWADDLVTPAPITDVVVYPQGALITRAAKVEVPQGTHRIILPLPPSALRDGVPRLSAAGDVVIRSTSLGQVPFDPKDALTPAQTAAEQTVKDARSALIAIEAEVSAARADIGALLAQQDFYQSVQGGGTLASPQALRDTAALLATELPRISAAIAQAEAALQPLNDTAEQAEEALARAQAALAALAPAQSDWPTLVIETSAETAGPLVLALDSLSRGSSWQSAYRLDLNEDTGAIAVDRSAVVQVAGDEPWTDVSLTLSTLFPFSQLAASEIFPQIVRSFDPEEPMLLATPRMMAKGQAEMMMADTAEERAGFATAQGGYDGAAFVYKFQGLQSVPAAGQTRLALAPATLSSEVEITANPRIDETAFLRANLTNDTGGPLLSGAAELYRDGRLVGSTRIDEVADGDEATLPFGPVEHIRLSYTIKDRLEGDRGILTKSNTRTDNVSFTVQNLGSDDETLTALYALPVSEQESLTVEITSDPAPSQKTTNDKRGVATWDLNVPAGTSKTVSIEMTLTWPEGEIVNWRP